MLTKVQPASDTLPLADANDVQDVSRFFAAELLGGDGMVIIEYRGERYLLTCQKRPGELALLKL